MNNVLIVDDERNIRDGIKALIDWEGMECQVVGDCVNGSLALDYIAKNPVDIVVTDIKMPVMDGLQLSHNLMEEYPDVPYFGGDKVGTSNVYMGFTYTGDEDDLLDYLFDRPSKIIQMVDSYF